MNCYYPEEALCGAQNKLEELRSVLKEVGSWYHDGMSVSEAWDYDHAPGSWAALLGE